MTLCVAALARVPNASFEKRDVVVFAADFQSEGETAKAEIGKKVAYIGRDQHIVLIAGTSTRAIDLAKRISGELSEPSKLSTDIQPNLERAVQSQKWHLADEYVSGALGMSYQDFLNMGKEKLPDDVYREMVYSISRQTLDCTLLVIAFAQMNPAIYRIHESGMVENCEHFAAVGSGYYIAESTLFQRSQQELDTVGRTIYNVYEAMRLGSYAPGVSKRFDMWVAEWEYDYQEAEADEDEEITDHGLVRKSQVLPEYYIKLEELYRKKYGPKPVGKVAFHPELLKKDELAMVATPLGQKHILDLEKAEEAANVPESKRKVRKNPDVKPSTSQT